MPVAAKLLTGQRPVLAVVSNMAYTHDPVLPHSWFSLQGMAPGSEALSSARGLEAKCEAASQMLAYLPATRQSEGQGVGGVCAVWEVQVGELDNGPALEEGNTQIVSKSIGITQVILCQGDSPPLTLTLNPTCCSPRLVRWHDHPPGHS
jgi:hypothetical protein